MPRAERRGLENSFAFWAAFLVVCVIGAALAVVHVHVKSTLVRAMTKRGFAVAESIGAVSTPSLLAYNYTALQAAAEKAAQSPDLVYVVLHDKEGTMAGFAGQGVSSGKSLPPLPIGIDQPRTRDVELETTAGKPIFEAIVPVRVEGSGTPWGTVRVGFSYAPLRTDLNRLDLGLGGLGLVLAMLGVLCSRWMARRITAPLRRLAEGTEALSAGDTTYRIPVAGARELAELAQAFNIMMDRVQEKAAESTAYQNQLAQLNATLEQQVLERTRALEESETQYRTLVEHSPDSILIVQGGRVRFVNRAFEEIFGVSESQALQPSFRLAELFEGGCADLVVDRLRSWAEGRSTGPAVVTARDASGARRELEIRGSRIEYLGEPAVECLMIDTTEAKRLREKLEDSQRLRALGELASGVAHDFNNLLGAILGRVQLLRRRGFDAAIDREMAVIEKAATDGRETVRRIQEFSRTRTDRPFQPLALDEIMRDAVEITRGLWHTDAQRRNVSVQVEVDRQCSEPPMIQGNATELREVFTNLILNAVDAMPQGGKLRLCCRRVGDRIRAEVEDTGVGMTEEIRRHLFDPFFTTKGQSGTGLGMSVAYGIVTRHGGTIDVTSSLGLGTRFVLELPHCDRPPVVAGGDGAAMPQLLRPGRILVIDDEQAIAQLVEDALSGDGHTVEIAVSGEDGLKMADVSTYDLVMTDLGMPDMSGWEVASRIHDRWPELPVILVTGWGSTITDDEVRRSGVAAVVHKPFEIKDLLETTRRVLAGSDEQGSGSL